MTFDETSAALRAGICVSRPDEDFYFVLEQEEEKSLTRRAKAESGFDVVGETIPCGGPELTGADIGYEVYRPRAVISDEGMTFLNTACEKMSVSSITLEKDKVSDRHYLRLSAIGWVGGELLIWVPKSAKSSGMIEGYAYRPEEIVTRGEMK